MKLQHFFMTTVVHLLGLFMTAQQVSGAIVATDWNTLGDQLLTLDTDTNLEWLDLTETQNLSYAYLESQFGPGGNYADFQHASLSQVDNLFANAGITERSGQYVATNYSEVSDLISLMGITYFGEYAIGYVSETYNGQHRKPFLRATSYNGLAQASVYSAGFGPDPDTNAGHWLVRTVPEPASLALLGLSGLILFDRRQRFIPVGC